MTRNEISIKNKKYISSKRSSEISGYTKDYISRLCREGGLECHRAGRDWFVDADSLLLHLKKSPRKNNKKNKLSKLSKYKEFFLPIVGLTLIIFAITGLSVYGKTLERFILNTTDRIAESLSPEIFLDLTAEIPRIINNAGDSLVSLSSLASNKTIDFLDKTSHLTLSDIENNLALPSINLITRNINEIKSGFLLFPQNIKEIVREMFWEPKIITEEIKESDIESLKKEITQLKEKNLTTQGPLIEKTVVERTVERILSGLTSEELDTKLDDLNNKLLSQIIEVKNQLNERADANYRAISLANRINYLTDPKINTPTIYTPVISTPSISGNTTAESANFSGNVSVGGNLSVAGSQIFTGNTTFANASTTLLTVSNSAWLATEGGNVGIGTTNPNPNDVNTRLNVFGSAGNNVTLEITGNKTDGDAQIEADVSFSAASNTTGSNGTRIALIRAFTAGTTATNRGGALGFFTKLDGGGLTEKMRITNTGNIGIGTTTPSANLTLKQLNNGDPMILAVRKTDTAPSGDFIDYTSLAGTTLFRVDNSGNLLAGGIITSGSQTITSVSTPQFRVQYDAADELTISVNSTGTTTIAVNGAVTPGLVFTPQSNGLNTFNFTNASSTSILSIDTADGRVGIGTTNPATNLDIVGSGTLLSGTASSFYKVYSRDSSNRGVLLGYDTSGQIGIIGAGGGSGNLAFYTHNGSTWGERMRLDLNGNVGIGTTSPYAKLSVAGPVIAEYFTATSSTASTFPYASTTALTVSGTNGLSLGSLNGPLQANNGAVSATTSILASYGGTGLTSLSSGSLVYGSGGNVFSTLAASTNGYVLALANGVPSWTATTTFSSPLNYSSGNVALGYGSSLTTSGSNLILNPANANSWTALQQFSNASTTLFSAYGPAYFGSTATSSFSAAGVLTLASPLAVSSGGTGQTSFAQGWLNSDGTTITSSTSPTVNYLTATSTTATTTLSTGGLAIGTSQFVVQQNSGNVGIGTTSPWGLLSVNPSGVSGPEFVVGSSSATHLVVSTAGNVGIGTTTPGATLTVGSGQIFAPSGSAASPSYSFSNDSNTGLFSSGADQLAISVGGTTRMTQDTDSFYGVGTGAPRISTKSTATYDEVTYGFVGDIDTGMYRGGANELRFSTANTDRLTINSSGNVGIGTTDLTSGSFSNKMVVKQGCDTNWCGLAIEGASVDNVLSIDYRGSNTFGLFTSYRSGGAYSDIVIGPGGSESVRFKTSGNVGVGTTSPYAKFSVHANNGETSTTLFSVASSTSSATTTLFTILNNGNVGIGTVSPQIKLDVNGSARISGSDSPTSGAGVEIIYSGGSQLGIIQTYDRTGATSLATEIRGSSVALATGSTTYFKQLGSVTQIIGNLYIRNTLDETTNQFRIINVGHSYIDYHGGDVYFRNEGSVTALTINDSNNNVIVNAGNLGIGTTSPYAKLSVEATAGGTTPLFVVASSTSGAGTSTALYVADNGNVGIGTMAPGSLLEVGAGGGNANYAVTVDLAGKNGIYINSNDYGIYSEKRIAVNGGISAGSYAGTVPPTNGFIISGNVGIGTTSPYAKLSVHANNGDINTTLFSVASSTSSATTTLFTVLNNGNVGIGTTSPDKEIHIYDSAGNAEIKFTNGAFNKSWHLGTSGGSDFGITETGVATRFAVQNTTGYVGIGTATPATNLHVNSSGDTAVRIETTSVTDGQIPRIYAYSPNNSADSRTLQIRGFNGTTYTGGMNILRSGGVFIFNQNSNGITLDSTGNVGIGTTSPYSLLSISNNASTTANTPLFTIASTTLGTSTSTLMTVLASGNVGIGTTSPVAQLHLDKAIDYPNTAPNMTIRNTNNSNVGGINFYALTDSAGGGFSFNSNLTQADWPPTQGTSQYSPRYQGTFGYTALNTNNTSRFFFSVANKGTAQTYTEVMSILNNGNVGIGTTSPGYPLDIKNLSSSITTVARLWGGSGGAGSGTELLLSNGAEATSYTSIGNYLLESGYSQFFIKMQGSEKVTVDPNGNVGIGTTSPVALLNVSGGITTPGTWVNNINTGQIHITGTDTSADNFVRLSFDNGYATGDAANAAIGAKFTSSGSELYFGTSGSYNSQINAAMVIANNGNVGIGTTSPATTLDVAGTGYTFMTIQTSGASRDVGIDFDATREVMLQFKRSGTAKWFIGTNQLGNDELTFRDGSQNKLLTILQSGLLGIGTSSPYSLLSISNSVSTAANTPLFTIASTTAGTATSTLLTVLASGNVGIGTTGPGYPLEVNGNIKATRIGLGANPDNSYSVWAAGTVRGPTVVADSFQSSTSGGTGTIRFAIDSPSGQTANLVQWAVNGGVLGVITSTGNIGIGTTSPYAKLSVEATAGGTTPLFVVASSTSGAGTSTALYVANNGYVGIGTTTPLGVLHTVKDSGSNDFFMDVYSDSAIAGIVGRKAKGTAATPTAVTADTNLFGMYGRGYGATGFSSTRRSALRLWSSENWTDSAQGSYITFETTPTGGTATAEKMRIDASGNVGIGTTGPSYKLDINLVSGDSSIRSKSADNNAQLLLDRGTTSKSNSVNFRTAGSDSFIMGQGIYSVPDTDFNIGNNAQSFVTIKQTSGNVGIGTTGPGAILHLQETHSGYALLRTSNTANGVGLKNWQVTNQSDGRLDFASVNDAWNSINATPLTLANGGNVGIGTTSPNYLLELSSQSGMAPLGISKSGDAAWIDLLRGGVVKSRIYSDNSGTNGGNLVFYTKADGGSLTQQVTILNSGNVGIGTTGPNSKVEIKQSSNGPTGGIRTIRSDTTGYADWFAGADGNAYVQLNASGYCGTTGGGANWACSSDERLKNVQGSFTRGLDDLLSINPILFRLKSAEPDSPIQAGFSAQNVLTAVPEAVNTGPDGFYRVDNLPILATTINAIKELNQKVSLQSDSFEALQAKVASSSLKIDELIASSIQPEIASSQTSIVSQGFSWIIEQFKTIGIAIANGIIEAKEFIAEKITVKKVVADSLEMKDSVTNEVYCVRISNGEWDKLRGTCGEVSFPEPAPAPAPAPAPEPTPVPEPVSEPIIEATTTEPVLETIEPAPEPEATTTEPVLEETITSAE